MKNYHFECGYCKYQNKWSIGWVQMSTFLHCDKCHYVIKDATGDHDGYRLVLDEDGVAHFVRVRGERPDTVITPVT